MTSSLRSSLVVVGFVSLVTVGCSDDPTVSPAPSGTAGGGAAGASGSVGAGKGGTAGSGGSKAGAGGSTAGAGGAKAGAGGSTAGTGGSTAGTGGSTSGAGGSASGAGGSASGAGGSASGAGGSTAGAGGDPAGAGGAAAGAGGSTAGAGGDTAGAGGSVAGAGGSTAGSGGASAGSAGTPTAGSAGSVLGGTGGQPAAGAGGSTAGTGGGGGAAPASAQAVKSIGFECFSDAQCGPGGRCLLEDSVSLFEGGPPSGLCTIDCTSWIGLTPDQQASTFYPCDPTLDITDPNAQLSAVCINYGTDVAPQGYCSQLCSFGEPPNPKFLQNNDPNKCHGRLDTACYPVTDEQGVYSFSFCRPLCQSDDQCHFGKWCDLAAGVCKATIPANKKKNGDLCDVSATESECAGGLCVRLYDASDPSVPASKKNAGICIDTCLFLVGNESCGGLDKGFCAFDLFGPASSPGGAAIPASNGDIGGCIEAAQNGKDTDCLWQEGWFTRELGPIHPFCLPATECTTLLDCAFDCSSDSDCFDGTTSGTCKQGKCYNPNNTPQVGAYTCQKVPEVCGKSFCLDHVVTGLPKNDPGVVCN